MSDEVSNRVGDYEILEFLGAGGMGKVFKVRNVISDRVEAMKVLLPELTAQEELTKRFLHEIKMLATLDHPNIAALHTALTIQGQFVMVMEYVEGVTIAKVMENGPIPVDKAVNYTEQVLSALSYAHQKGIIHRDIKPANMMLTGDGTIKLMDFGIARSSKDSGMTSVGTTVGSLYYMSPEQVKGEPIDGRSDLYALGISLYEMVTGQKPFASGTDYSIMAAHLKETPRPPIEVRPDIPSALNEIILIAVAKEPAQRFQSPDAMRKALGNISGRASYATKIPVAVPLPMPSPAGMGGATAAFALSPETIPPQPTLATNIVAPPPPQSTYVPMPVAPRGGHRGLYMTLGALIVLAGLVVAGVYIPKRSHTQAGAENTPSTSSPQSSTPAITPTASTTTPDQSSNPTAAATSPDENASAPAPSTTDQLAPPIPSTNGTPAKPTKKQVAKVGVSGNRGMGNSGRNVPGNAGVDAGQAAQRAAEEQELSEVEHQSDLLGSRMASVDSSLNSMRNAQSQQGVGMRGDILAAHDRLHGNLMKLQSAIQNHDLKSAKRYMDLCDRDADTIEKFLGH